jgi:hypothetical protein
LSYNSLNTYNEVWSLNINSGGASKTVGWAHIYSYIRVRRS